MKYMHKFVFDEAAYQAFRLTIPTPVEGEFFVWGQYEYDIGKALFVITTLSLPLMSLSVKGWAKQLGMDGPKDEIGYSFHILNGITDKDALAPHIDYSIPIIFAEHAWGSRNRNVSPLLIDGNKRLRKAFLEGVENISGFLIPKNVALTIRQ